MTIKTALAAGTVAVLPSRHRAVPPGHADFLLPSTLAAACAGRTVSGVIAIRACLRGEDPERKRSRQLQRSFEAALLVMRCTSSPSTEIRHSNVRSLCGVKSKV